MTTIVSIWLNFYFEKEKGIAKEEKSKKNFLFFFPRSSIVSKFSFETFSIIFLLYIYIYIFSTLGYMFIQNSNLFFFVGLCFAYILGTSGRFRLIFFVRKR